MSRTRQPALAPEQSPSPETSQEPGALDIGLAGFCLLNPFAGAMISRLRYGSSNADMQDMMMRQRSPADLLTDGGLLDRVTGKEAGVALDLLGALPEDQRRQALAGLDDDAFEALLDATPPERRQELGELAASEPSARRRLELWGAGAIAEAEATLDTPEGELEPTSPHRESVRRETAESRIAEIEDELAHARDLDPRRLGHEAVDETIRRKTLESVVEDTHGVNLTSTPAEQGPLSFLQSTARRERDRRVWSEADLYEIDGTLSKIPSTWVADNPALKEIHRGEGGEAGAIAIDDDLSALGGVGDAVASGVGGAVAEAYPDVVAALERAGAGWTRSAAEGPADAESSKFRFSQLFGRAVQDPGGLAQELLDLPGAEAERAMAEKWRLADALDAARARGEDTTELEASLRAAEEALSWAVDRRDGLAAEWRLIQSALP